MVNQFSRSLKQFILHLTFTLILIGCNNLDLPNPTDAEEAGQFNNYTPLKDSTGKTLTNPNTNKPYNVFPIEIKVDGKVYKQNWMAENLITQDNIDGFFSYDEALVACPAGWSLPNDEDWRALIILSATKVESDCLQQIDSLYSPIFANDSLMGTCPAYAGEWLKASTGWNGFEGIDKLHFTALPEGYIDYDGTFLQGGEYAYFWSSTEVDSPIFKDQPKSASSWYISKSQEVVHQENYSTLKFSVRCIQK